MPTLFVLIVLNYLDRNALAAARVQGIEKDLGMKGNDFNVTISVLFVGYILGQLPSNYILSRTRPSIYLAAWVMIWGVVSACTAAAQNFSHLVVIRFFLGFAEAPYFPGALFLLSSWYTKKELAFRMAFLYSGSLLSGAFSGFISAGITAGMSGTLGLSAWRWMFIIEGAITVAGGLIALFLLPDYPSTTRWLSSHQKALAVYRLQLDAGESDEEQISFVKSLKLAASDYKLWLLALIQVTKTTAAAVTSFIPTVVNTFGMSKTNTLLLTAPPYLFATVVALCVSFSSDRKPERCYHLAIPIIIAAIGNIIAATTKTIAPRYLALFLLLGGIYGSFNVCHAWTGSLMARPRAKRAMSYAIVNAVANLAQVWTPYMYDSKYSPHYTIAFSVNVVMCAIAVSTCFILRFLLVRANRTMDIREAGGEAGSVKLQRYVL